VQHLPRGRQAIQVRHANVEDDDIGLQSFGEFERFPAVGRFSADFPSFMFCSSEDKPRVRSHDRRPTKCAIHDSPF